MSGAEAREYLGELYEDVLFADGYDDAIMGFAERCGLTVVLYDSRKCIEILVERDGMTDEEAWEWFSYNVLGAYVGEKTPMFAFLKEEF
ncbi:hypothetical protein bcgnr5369_02470 [Bacillus cereus]|uniref:hypothetical protein n=1 Tax=Bacillus cereus TaxID=1396 RepID=UPI000BFC4E26|nr:hypothetical protein [Bacillus cereus]PGP11588.1 hypothetical protein COA01_35650 [Bacillus cereus]